MSGARYADDACSIEEAISPPEQLASPVNGLRRGAE
jgi:hypothetical protein